MAQISNNDQHCDTDISLSKFDNYQCIMHYPGATAFETITVTNFQCFKRDRIETELLCNVQKDD